MKAFWDDMKFFWSNKFYAAVVSLAAVYSYGFKIAHETIGIDDTCISLYFEEGLAPAVGRWTLFLVNKLFHISDFAPWMTELAGVLLLLFAAAAWCVVFSRILGREKYMAAYAFFSALFLSCPLISEIYVYYLHNGISLAYGLTAMGLLLLLKALEPGTGWKRRGAAVLAAGAVLAVALGCYESFMIVFAEGMILLFLLARGWGNRKGNYTVSPWAWGGATAATAVSALGVRWLALRLVLGIFHIEIPAGFGVEYRSVFAFMNQGAEELSMNLKRHLVKYFLNAFAYQPILILVL